MSCITTVTYRVKVNKNLTEVIVPQRGLRQGCPLSPYLFILCVEGLSALFQKAEEDGSLHGVQVCPAAPRINHLFFADDSLIFLKVNDSSARKLQDILALYEDASGQMVNIEKSAIMFSKGISTAAKRKFKGLLHIEDEAFSDRYLGLSVHLGRSVSTAFGYLKEKIWKKIQGWKEKFLSRAGKEILVKAVAQAIPIYAMSCFDITKTFCDDISSMVCRYWWNNQEEDRHHWLSWQCLSKPKCEGGLGFRDLHIFNLAMLARQGWRLLQDLDSLCGRVLRAKYFPNGNILEAKASPGILYTWRSILKGVSLLKEGLIWRVGDGTNIKVWQDPWIPVGDTRKPRSLRGRSPVSLVADLLDPSTGDWDADIVRSLFQPEDVKAILSISIRDGMEDNLAWHFDPKGLFSVKSAYKVGIMLRDRRSGLDASSSDSRAAPGSPFDWNHIWQLKATSKVKMFVWRLAHNSLAHRMKMLKLGVDLDTKCPICNRHNEDGGHVFLKCKKAKTC
jgi:hypothetical protein